MRLRKHLEVVGEGMSREKSIEILERLKARIRTRGLDLCTSVFDLQWDEYFRSLEEYTRRTGEANPPKSHKETVTLEDGKEKELNLGKWCSMQRTRKARLSQERKDKLDSIKFVWDVDDHSWNQNYNALCMYRSRTGEANPPQSHKETVTLEHGMKKELNLGNWCRWQRKRKAQLSQERKDKLDSIKFVWDVEDHSWNQNYNALCMYTSRTGEANPPQSHKETVTMQHGKTKELNLGSWCSTQRRDKAQLSEERR